MSENPDMSEMDLIREQIMLSCLRHVPFDGWSVEALNAGAADAGYDDAMALRAFSGDMGSVIKLWGAWSDQQMLDALDEIPKWDEMSVPDRVSAAVKSRIMVNAEHQEAFRRAASWLAMPIHIPLAMQGTLRTVNAMWYAAGDTATDWNYYSKRGILSTIYTATVLYWLSDTPDEEGDYPQTWEFLARRLKDLGTITKAVKKVKNRMAPCI